MVGNIIVVGYVFIIWERERDLNNVENLEDRNM